MSDFTDKMDNLWKEAKEQKPVLPNLPDEEFEEYLKGKRDAEGNPIEQTGNLETSGTRQGRNTKQTEQVGQSASRRIRPKK